MTPPSTQGGGDIHELNVLTMAAREAADQGRWDVVADCYRCRGERLQQVSLPPHELAYLLLLDQEIQQRIVVAQTALTSMLQQSARVCMQLDALRKASCSTTTGPGVMVLEA